MNRPSLQALMAAQSPGGRGLLAGEILTKSGRRHGPVDDKCETCGKPAETFTLADWIHWSCPECCGIGR